MRLFLSTLLVLLTSHAVAEVVTVDVTIKSVNVESRGLEITYKTTLGDKTAVLDVSRNATITINDQEGTLEELKAGFIAKVEYHKELAELVGLEQFLRQWCRPQSESSVVGRSSRCYRPPRRRRGQPSPATRQAHRWRC